MLENQNDPTLIKYLKASTVSYTKSKAWEIRITYIYLFLAVAYPVSYMIIQDEQAKLILFICSFFLTIGIQLTVDTLKGSTTKGAVLKEMFDIAVFQLPWKSTLKKIPDAEINALASRYKGPEIIDWYSTHVSPSVPKT